MRFRIALGLLAAATLLPGCPSSGGADPDFLPLPPDGVAASALTTTTAQVTWNDLSDNEASFIIQTSPDNIVWTNNTVVAQNVTTGVATGLVPGVLAFIRVASSNVKGPAPSAASVTVTPLLPAWASRAAGPGALFWTCSAFDPSRRLMLVFGGRDEFLISTNTLSALSLDGAPPTWLPVTPILGNTPPTARFGSSLIYDPLGDRLILFGGQVGMASTAEVWEFRLATSEWFALGTSGPPPSTRQHHTAVYDADLERMVIYGGENENSGGVYDPDVYALTLPAAGTPTWSTFPITGSAPLPRTHHSAVYDVDSGRMIVFGGLGDGSSLTQDTWALNLSSPAPSAWTPLTPSGVPPSFRAGHMAVLDSINRQMVVFGGADDTLTPNDEVWTLTLSGPLTWRNWNPLAPTPGGRYFSTAIFDPVTVRMTQFGGTVDDVQTPTDETWSLGL